MPSAMVNGQERVFDIDEIQDVLAEGSPVEDYNKNIHEDCYESLHFVEICPATKIITWGSSSICVAGKPRI